MKKILPSLAALFAVLAATAATLPTGWQVMPQGKPPASGFEYVLGEFANGPAGALFGWTPNNANGVIVYSHEGQTGADQRPWRIFDGVSMGGGDNKWCANPVNGGGWVVYQFANRDKWAVTNFHLRTSGTTERVPRIWQLEGSNDLAGNNSTAVLAATWDVLLARDLSDPVMANNSWNAFLCAENQTAYNAYRINVIRPSTVNSHVEIAQWQMFAHSGAAQIQLDAADNITHFTADLTGYFENHSGDAFDLWLLCYTADRGTSLAAWQSVGAATKIDAGAFSTPVFTNTVRGLAPNVPHYARVCAVSEHAVAWSDPISFTPFNAGLPAVRSLAATGVTETSATANGELRYVPADPLNNDQAFIRLLWGKDPDNWAHVEELGWKSVNAPLVFDAFPTLDTGATYAYLFTASNATGFAESPEAVFFTTSGAPLLGVPRASVFSNAARFHAELLSAGSGETRVSLWAGPNAGSLAPVHEWPATEISKAYDRLLDPAPHSPMAYAFMASNIVNGVLSVVWTATNSFTVANNTLAWDNAEATGKWDVFSSKNWHLSHVTTAFGSHMFLMGDSVVFPAVSGAATTHNVTLEGDADVESFSFTQPQGQNATLNLNGAHDLWLLRSMAITKPQHFNVPVNGVQEATLYPRLTGPGGIFLTNATLNLRNPANDFEGGIRVPQGQARAVLSAPASTALGTGGVTLGQDVIELFTPPNNRLHIERAQGVSGALTNATPGALATRGLYTSARVVLNDANTAARFGSIAQDVDGATVSMDGTGALILDAPPADIFPPWAVASNGGFLLHKNGRAAVANPSEMAAHGIGVFNAGSIPADTNVVHAWVDQTDLNLAGRTMTLTGKDGMAGLYLRNSLIGGGALDLDGNDLYAFLDLGDRNIHASFLNAPSLYVFGSRSLNLFAPVLPGRIIMQEGSVALNSPVDYEYNGFVYAFNTLSKNATPNFTWRGNGGLLFHCETFNVNGGTNTFADGVGVMRNTLGWGNYNPTRMIVTNATLAGTSGPTRGTTSGLGGHELHLDILAGGVVAYTNVMMFGNNSHVTVRDGGLLYIGNRGGFSSGSAHSTLNVLDNGRAVFNSFMQHLGGPGYTLTVNDATVQWNGELRLGENPSAHNFLLDIQDGGVSTHNSNILVGQGNMSDPGNSNQAVPGANGTNNHIRVRIGGTLNIPGAHTLQLGRNAGYPQDPAPVGNALVPAGGAVNAHNLLVLKDGVYAPEIQANGFGVACDLGAVHFRGTVTFHEDSVLRPSAVKGAPGGRYCLLTSNNAIINNGWRFEPVESPGAVWGEPEIDNLANPKALYVKLSKIGTLLMVR